MIRAVALPMEQKQLTSLLSSDAKRDKIKDLLEYIQARLDELEEEKEELKQYQVRHGSNAESPQAGLCLTSSKRHRADS